ncbi:MAG TPA: DinB family protein [Dehalococcoidia bacterium]|nr:DinB family protein [Dehalococcoidia bacterium]
MTNELVTGEVFGEDKEGPRAFLLAEAGKPFAALRPALDAAYSRLLAALRGVSEAQASFKPGGEDEDAYSIGQIVRHVARVQAWIESRMRATAQGNDPERFVSEIGREEKPLAGSTHDLEETYRLLNAAADEIAGREDVAKTAPHPFFGELNCRGWYRLAGLHAEDHARQVERIKAIPEYPKE